MNIKPITVRPITNKRHPLKNLFNEAITDAMKIKKEEVDKYFPASRRTKGL